VRQLVLAHLEDMKGAAAPAGIPNDAAAE